MAKHAPEPWMFAKSSNETFAGYIYDDNYEQVANVWPPMANTHLIATAPELLKELKWLLQQIEGVGEEMSILLSLDGARAAIAKAEDSKELVSG